ncbi:hypothetical protein [Vibrio sp. PNB22_4_1]|uniref:hypothetical protein n=1 Tax=unclassified Vibrio TaxID=2614977 RepID=UPI00406A80FC
MNTFPRHQLEDYQLAISDSELLAYIYSVDPSQRDRLVLAALRIGFTTLSEAKSDIDRKVVSDMTDQLCTAMIQQQGLLEKRMQSWLSDEGQFSEALSKNIGQLETLFAPDNPSGIAPSIRETVLGEVSKLSEQWSLDHQNSAFSRLQALLIEQTKQLSHTLYQRLDELKALQLEQQIRKDEALKGTRHGEVFEEELNSQLGKICSAQGHQFEATGEIPGLIKNCKVGDAVITLSPDHLAAGANIVVEAKQSKSYSIKKALDEIATGRKNRNAEVGIFVLSSARATASWPIFQRFHNDIIVVWNAEDPETDIYLEAALSVAIALCTKKQYQASDLPDFVPMQQAVIDLEKQLEGCDEIAKLCKTIMGNGEKIMKRAELMGGTAKEKIADLYRCLEQLNRLEIGLIE